MFAQDDGPTTEWLKGYSDNIVTVVAAALVFFMQAGFAFLGAGLIRSKNTTNYLTKSFMDFAIASLGFWAFGFAFMLGDTAGGFIGLTGWFLTSGDYVSWIFQMVFAATAATIVAGAMAERTKLQAYLAYSFFVSALIYPIYGHWVWGGGWLADMGALDYAGSGVVHAVGGFVALAGAAVVGPRMGKFINGKAQDMPAHSTPFVVAGTFILFFGWFGFNIGWGDDIGLNAVNTLLSGATGAVVALYITLIVKGKADILMACNGALAGLVGITAPVNFVDPWAAVVIGAIAAPIMYGSVMLIERVFKIDDPVGAISVHGVTGLWGLLAIAIFAKDGGFVGGSAALIVPADRQHCHGGGVVSGHRLRPVLPAEVQHGHPGQRGRGTAGPGTSPSTASRPTPNRRPPANAQQTNFSPLIAGAGGCGHLRPSFFGAVLVPDRGEIGGSRWGVVGASARRFRGLDRVF